MIKKPKKQTREYWHYRDVEKYVQEKLGINLNDVCGKYTNGYFKENKDTPYRNFWHWITDQVDIHNGCFFYLPCEGEMEEEDKWVLPILREFHKIVKDDEIYVDW